MMSSTSSVLYAVLVISVVGVCIGLLAPFGLHQIPVYISIAYWVTACLVGYVIYLPIISLCNAVLVKPFPRSWLRVAIGTFIASVVMSLVIPIITWWFLGSSLNIADQFTFFFPKCLLIGGIITLIGVVREHIIEQKRRLIESEQVLKEAVDQVNDMFDKAYYDFIKHIPLKKRGKLLCLEMSDHYVKIHTNNGHHMMLMRFKDAMTSLDSYPGLQTHRSWWVAKDAVTQVQRAQRKIQLVLESGQVVPVSRTYEKSLVEAGLFA